jgi:hypothetical protein
MYRTLRDVLAPVSKILVDPKVKDVSLYQASEKSGMSLPIPPRSPGP